MAKQSTSFSPVVEHSTRQLPETGFVRFPDVQRFFPISRAEFYEGIKDGRYPSPVRLAPRVSAWRVEDVRALIERVSRTGTACIVEAVAEAVVNV